MSSPSQEEKVNNKSENRHLRRDQLTQENKKILNHRQSDGTVGKQQNIENANIKQENVIKKQGQINKQFKSVIVSKLIFISLTILQFCNLLALILIQYISSKVHLALFLIILIFALVLHFILLGIACQIKMINLSNDQRKFCQKQEDLLNRGNNKKQSQISTLPKINYHIRKRSFTKTKKLQYPHDNISQQQNTQQTIKRVSATIKQYIIKQQRIQQQISQRCTGYEIYCLIVIKTIQILLEIVYPTLAITLLYQEQNSHRQVVIALSIVAYILSTVSIVSFVLLLKDIRCFFQAKIVNEYILEAKKHKNKNKQQIKSKISIDQLIQLKNDQIKSILSINKFIKSGQLVNQEVQDKNQKDKSQNEQEQQPQQVHSRKMEIKKSVLKSSKNHQPRMRKIDDDQVIQRRKVQINSKKIQYFQYLEITPPNSVIDDQEQANPKTPQKTHRNNRKMKYLRKRMQNQAQFLKNKRMNRQANVRSSIFLYNTKKQEIIQLGQSNKNPSNLLNYSLSL